MPSAFGLMLATHCKRTETVDLKTPLLAYIKGNYGDRDAEDANDDLVAVQQLRAEVALASANAATPGMRESLVKYFRQLTSIENRFPISKEKGHVSITFVWFDAFRPKTRVSQPNVHFEKSCVLFNLGAVLNQNALSCDRTTPDGLQQACKLFQEAAGVFAFLKEGEGSKLDSPRPQDLSPETLVVMEKLMLAQAQECVYLKAVLDKKGPTTVARLAKQVGVMYEEVDRCFSSPALSTYFDKGWSAHTQLKSSVYDVETLAQVAKGLHAEDRVNVEVAVLREAFARVQNTKKLAKAVGPDMVDSIARVQDALTLALSKAEKENNTIYLQKVPAFSEAGVTVQGALLVKPVTPSGLDTGAENMFSSLIPDSAAKALSRYTDLVDGVMRQQRDALAAATDTARIKLKEWELPDTLEVLDPRSTPNSLAASCLPPALLSELEDVQSIGGISHLTGILAEIGELRKGVDKELSGAAAALEGDAQEDAEVRAKYGDAIRAPPAATAAKPYWDKIAQYRASMTSAGDSDAGVMSRLEDRRAAFQDLAIDTAALKMPRLQAPLVAVGPEDPAQVVAALRRDLDQLQALASERSGMEEALKDLKNKDNILPRLMAANPQSHDALFASELKKYDTIAADIAANAAAQTALLARIDAGNKAFRSAFDVSGWKAACNTAAAGVRETVGAFRELLDHCSEGLRFYLGMSDVVRRARQEVDDWAFTRRVQREEMVQDIERRKRQEEDDALARRMAMAGLSGPGKPQGAPPHPPTAYPAAPAPPPPHPSSAPPPPPPPQHVQAAAGPPPPPHGPPPPQGPPAQQGGYGGSFSGPPPPGLGHQGPPPPGPGGYYAQQQQYPPQQYPPQGYMPQQYAPPPPHYGGPPPPHPHYGQQHYGGPPPPAPYGYGAPPPPQGGPPPPGQYHYAQAPPPSGWGQ